MNFLDNDVIKTWTQFRIDIIEELNDISYWMRLNLLFGQFIFKTKPSFFLYSNLRNVEGSTTQRNRK